MLKIPWATKEQLGFMTSHLPGYLEAQLTKEYSGFWPDFYQAWFTQWPERREVFPDKPMDEQLTAQEECSLGLALKIQCKVNSTCLLEWCDKLIQI